MLIDQSHISKPASRLHSAARTVKTEVVEHARQTQGRGDSSRVSSEARDKPRGLLSGLLNGLAENYGEVKQTLESPETNVKIDGVVRTVRGALHARNAAHDLASDKNQVLRPGNPISGRSGKDPSQLSVTSWNLHHGTSQDVDGARSQLKQQIERLKKEGADITLLQEVLPWQAQEIVQKTGKVGYYSQTTPRQGNMILVDPGLEVENDARQTLNHSTPKGDLSTALKTAWAHGGKEPRAAQALRIKQPDGQGSLAVFNTHLSTGKATDEDRQAESRNFVDFVRRHSKPGDAVIGGGDLNMSRNSSWLDGFRQEGFKLDGARIDHFATKGVRKADIDWADQYTAGTRLSDHPMLSGQFELP